MERVAVRAEVVVVVVVVVVVLVVAVTTAAAAGVVVVVVVVVALVGVVVVVLVWFTWLRKDLSKGTEMQLFCTRQNISDFLVCVAIFQSSQGRCG